MKSGSRVALAVGFGYLLGRRKKMRTALTLAAAVAAGRASRRPGGLKQFGADLMAANPQLRNLGGLGPPLVAAGRAAATAAAGSGIDAIGGRLRGGADALRRKSGAGRPDGARSAPEAERSAPNAERSAPDEEQELDDQPGAPVPARADRGR
ncbi:hypothetical protein F8279_05915 [Micromonospora sp. AMSO1212t]|uniref:Uncharacterized protein n=1 Tax=Micromonospora tulbaghiae TaxID=479978 RepID=A0ABY0KRM0_9ACTN|nr:MULTISPECIES: hypothetical protein [Micromonospora]KAB1908849.1 hypothetical protein F8279_05915 [Micromonospora sp. AMSO1212t]MDX5458453.1 hypothetical protein [Micromonospora tulbaghiae]SCF03913.1 hypothetical protein GA0070562_5447 [Micromonospora tulbaghiae]